MSARIALVDDDQNILLSLSAALSDEGYTINTYCDGAEALKALERQPVNLVVLDIKMPRMDGLELLTKLRLKSSLPVILLTSRDDEIDEIMGLRMGADDYIKKPFSQRLLMERVRAVLRRHDFSQNHDNGEQAMLRGDLTLDAARHLCAWKSREVNLTVTEFLIVKSLAHRPGHV